MEEQNTVQSVRKYVIFGVGAVLCVGVVIVGIFLLTSGEVPPAPVVSDQVSVDGDIVNDPDPIPDDVDRDGLSDTKEQELGLSVVNPDTDADGLFDNDEMTVWKSDPLKFDTDGDGFGDGWEVLKGYNPAGPGLLSIENN